MANLFKQTLKREAEIKEVETVEEEIIAREKTHENDVEFTIIWNPNFPKKSMKSWPSSCVKAAYSAMERSGYNDLEDTTFSIGNSLVRVILARLPKELVLHGGFVEDFVKAFQNSNLPAGQYKLKIICRFNGVEQHLWKEGVLNDLQCMFYLYSKDTEYNYNIVEQKFEIK